MNLIYKDKIETYSGFRERKIVTISESSLLCVANLTTNNDSGKGIMERAPG